MIIFIEVQSLELDISCSASENLLMNYNNEMLSQTKKKRTDT